MSNIGKPPKPIISATQLILTSITITLKKPQGICPSKSVTVKPSTTESPKITPQKNNLFHPTN
jgi:hypothetical protein